GAPHHPLERATSGLPLGESAELGRVDPDRAGEHLHLAVADPERVALDLGTHLQRREVAEGLEPLVGMKADDIISEERRHEIVRFWENGEEAPRRPRGVEEEPDAAPDAALAQLRAERNHVIVLNPDRVLGLD